MLKRDYHSSGQLICKPKFSYAQNGIFLTKNFLFPEYCPIYSFKSTKVPTDLQWSNSSCYDLNHNGFDSFVTWHLTKNLPKNFVKSKSAFV